MQDLLDVAHANATMTKILEGTQFLAAQREPSQQGYMGAIDTELAAKENCKARRMEKGKARPSTESEKRPSSSSSADSDSD